MKKLNEVTKFEIITAIKETPEVFSNRTIPEISKWILGDFGLTVSTDSLYRWAKLYNFSFKAQKKKPAPSQEDAIKRTNQRIHILGIVIRNLCKELELKQPTILDKLLAGITEQYGPMNNLALEMETYAVEEKVYDTI